jgi:uncharacterized protein YndB with AHSA1/START domain
MKTILGKLEFALEREIVIRAPRALVFRYFTDPERWARWWGKGSTIDGRVGGKLGIVYPGGTTASGEVLELRPPERIVFSYGYDGAGKPIAPGGSRVTIQLAEHPHGTRLAFLHELADAAARDHHVQGWRYHLAVFANVVTNEAHAGAGKLADAWFAAWNEPDAARRRGAFNALLAEDGLFQDSYSCTRGLEDLVAHVAGAKVHMPGLTLERSGEPRHCQGTLLADWIAKMPDGKTLARGTSVFELTADGRIARVVGIWG